MLTVLNAARDPFYNLAFAESVFRTFRDGDVFLLWQNAPAVVVGSDQNICREVRVESPRRASPAGRASSARTPSSTLRAQAACPAASCSSSSTCRRA